MLKSAVTAIHDALFIKAFKMATKIEFVGKFSIGIG